MSLDPVLRRAFGRAVGYTVGWLIAASFVGGVYMGITGQPDDAPLPRWITLVRLIGAGVVALGVVGGGLKEFRGATRARRASVIIDEALQKLGNVADVTPEQVAQSVAEAPTMKVRGDHLSRLVEQRRQKRLIDDEWFQAEVGKLIVNYLQPLPRNAKRVLNRFRVTLLIAERRGLLTSEPKVSPRHIGKWLVLAERWPLLRLSLSAVPHRMRQLEEHALAPPPTSDDRRPDLFMDSIKTLAPFYVGDEDLRTFIRSEPRLARILPRLVHFGDVEDAAPKSAAGA